MNITIFTLIGTALISASLPLSASDYSSSSNSSNEEYRYKGRYGNEYKYDLNKPIDKMRYETDIGAQMRDQMPSVNLHRELERDSGQYGGGIRR